jgi:PadR family transcriptional regulator, regulatory protein PadR
MAVRKGPQKVTVPTLQVLDVLLAEPARDDWFGFDLCRLTRLSSGTVTQILFRLESWGWLASRWEDTAEAHGQGRPRRRLYRLTGTGEVAARSLMVERFPGHARWTIERGTA